MANASIKAAFERMWQHITNALDSKSDSDHSHADLQEQLDEKSQVQMVTSESSEILPTLKIHKLTQEEYNQELTNGTIDENALYLTPEEEIDLSGYATEEYVNNAIATIPTPDVSGQIENHNTSIDAHADIRSLIASLDTLVGDVAVSSQISTAIEGFSTEEYVDNAVTQKSQVQIITWEADD